MEQHSNRSILDLVPPTWFSGKEGSSIWLTGYRMYGVQKEELVRTKVLYLDQACAVFHWGTINYQDSSQAKVEFTDTLWMLDPKSEDLNTPEGAYLLLLVPFDVDGIAGNESTVRAKISIVTGLLAAFGGRNIVFECIFDNILDLASNQRRSFSSVLVNPATFLPPNINGAKLNAISNADQALARCAELERNRIGLSLRWFEAALYSIDIDGYLKFWFALETLGMPNTSDIRPIITSLSNAYGLSSDDARNRFAIGRLFGLRCRIVHDGQIIPIHTNLFDYIQALYVDVLFEHLGVPCEQRANKILDRPDFDLNSYLYEK